MNPALCHASDDVMKDVPPEALLAAASEAGVPPSSFRAMRAMSHYKSRIVFVGVGGDDEPRFVVKSEPAHEQNSRWSPRNEFEGLRFVARSIRGTPGMGAIEAVAWGNSPRFLVTRYEPGESVRPAFDRAMRHGIPDQLAHTCDSARRIALWLRTVRDGSRGDGPGMDERGYEESCAARAAEIRAPKRHAAALAPAMLAIRGELGCLNADERSQMCESVAAHGDLAPQNFLERPSGELIALDLEGFGHRPLNIDLSGFRTRLEHYALRGRGMAACADRVWSAFLESFLDGREHRRFAMLCCVHRLMSQLAWLTHERERLGRSGRGGLFSRVRDALWVRSRLRWLSDWVASSDRPALFSARL